MNYQKTIDFLYQQLATFHRIGADAYHANLDITVKLMDSFHHPHKNYKTIHVAGTNGKGSVSHFLASIFQEAGYKTGLYTSPHLKDFRERIKVNGEMLPENYVTAFVESNRELFGTLKPSFFEMTTAMAFTYFSEQKVDIAIVETGLGGRLDSTNVIQPETSVITNIGKDHVSLLGNTLRKIAAEKAGIIKPGTPVVIGKVLRSLRPVFDVKASSVEAPVFFSSDNFKIISAKSGGEFGEKLLLDVSSKDADYTIVSPLAGLCQRENILTVLQTCEVLNRNGFSLSQGCIQQGISKVIENTGLMGRWQILSTKPLTICDTGHNVDGIKQVMRQLKTIDCDKRHIVFGMVNDKDAESILKLLLPDASYFFCKPSIPRGLDANILQMNAKAYGLNGQVYPTVMEAYNQARLQAKEDDLIFVGGSNFVVAEIL